jgi:uncharacterized protein (DUF2252 family)
MPNSKLNPSVEERLARGKALRKKLPRAEQCKWLRAEDRPDPIAILQEADRGRVESLLPIKYGRMSVSPFGCFRGAAPVMAHDLSKLPHTDLAVQMCGDAHIRNLGAYASPEGNLVFDINDFDESIPGPWEWDLKRLATSFVLGGRECGTSDSRCGDAVRALVASYRDALFRFAHMPFLDLVRHQVKRLMMAKPVQSILQQAERSTPLRNLQKLTERTGSGVPRFASRPPLLRRLRGAEAQGVIDSLPEYRESLGYDRQLIFDAYRPVDVAMKIVGTGSVGTRDYVVLFFGIGEDDPLFLQVKQEMPSCYQPYLDVKPSAHQGRRTAEGQRRMQTISDPLLGWTTIAGNDYLVRQLADHKSSIDPTALSGSALMEYAVVCGEVFARAHARTGDAAALAGYCGKAPVLDEAIRRFALSYADMATADYDVLRAAIRKRRVKAVIA